MSKISKQNLLEYQTDYYWHSPLAIINAFFSPSKGITLNTFYNFPYLGLVKHHLQILYSPVYVLPIYHIWRVRSTPSKIDFWFGFTHKTMAFKENQFVKNR